MTNEDLINAIIDISIELRKIKKEIKETNQYLKDISVSYDLSINNELL